MVPPKVEFPIREWLLRPLNTAARDAARAAAGSRSRCVAHVAQGQAEGAVPESIRFFKHREHGGQHVCAVTWVDGEGTQKQGVFSVVVADTGGWYAIRGSHWGGCGSFPVRRFWLNAGGGGRPLYIGGRVLGTTEAARVRITLPNGTAVEDDVGESGWALFPTGQPSLEDSVRAGTVEVLDAAGRLLNRHRLFGNSDPL